jgi:hypothetical protein
MDGLGLNKCRGWFLSISSVSRGFKKPLPVNPSGDPVPLTHAYPLASDYAGIE